MKTIYNPCYKDINNCYSLYLAIQNLNEDIIIINSDVVFDSKILKKLLDINQTSLVVDNVKKLTKESMKVYVDGNKVMKINKAYGEYIGIARILKKDLQPLRESLKKLLKIHLIYIMKMLFR